MDPIELPRTQRMLRASLDAMPSMKVVSAGDGVPVVKGD